MVPPPACTVNVLSAASRLAFMCGADVSALCHGQIPRIGPLLVIRLHVTLLTSYICVKTDLLIECSQAELNQGKQPAVQKLHTDPFLRVVSILLPCLPY